MIDTISIWWRKLKDRHIVSRQCQILSNLLLTEMLSVCIFNQSLYFNRFFIFNNVYLLGLLLGFSLFDRWFLFLLLSLLRFLRDILLRVLGINLAVNDVLFISDHLFNLCYIFPFQVSSFLCILRIDDLILTVLLRHNLLLLLLNFDNSIVVSLSWLNFCGKKLLG